MQLASDNDKRMVSVTAGYCGHPRWLPQAEAPMCLGSPDPPPLTYAQAWVAVRIGVVPAEGSHLQRNRRAGGASLGCFYNRQVFGHHQYDQHDMPERNAKTPAQGHAERQAGQDQPRKGPD